MVGSRAGVPFVRDGATGAGLMTKGVLDLGEAPILGWPDYPVALHVPGITQRSLLGA